MSQEKVDRYKKEKANRQKIMKREKWMTRLEITAFAVVLAGLVGWFSLAVYNNSKAEKAASETAQTTTMNVTDIQKYLSDVTSDDEEEETSDTASSSQDSAEDAVSETTESDSVEE